MRSEPFAQDVSEAAVDRINKLLDFDKAMRKEAVRLQLEAIKADAFLGQEQLEPIIQELGGLSDFKELSPPRFTSVINLVRALDENDDVDLHSDLHPLLCVKKVPKGATPTEDNACRKGLLQMLYGSGFQKWFADNATDKDTYTDIIKTVLEQKNDPKEQYERKIQGKKIPAASELAESLDLGRHETLTELLNALARQALRETDQDTRYRASSLVQTAVANRIERFKREIFAHLFAKYLKGQKLTFIAGITQPIEPKPRALENAMAKFTDDTLKTQADWHAQFDTWLYLVPPQEISLLRHQMKKSVALETKSPTKTDEKAIEMLEQMDRLMALYIQVPDTRRRQAGRVRVHRTVLQPEAKAHEQRHAMSIRQWAM